MSSTKDEFTMTCDTTKEILYIQSILDKINIHQQEATSLFIDNNCTLFMANVQQITRQTHHMDIKHLIHRLYSLGNIIPSYATAYNLERPHTTV